MIGNADKNFCDDDSTYGKRTHFSYECLESLAEHEVVGGRDVNVGIGYV